MKSHKKQVIGGVVICVAVVVILLNALSSCSVKSLTVSELLEKSQSIYGQKVRVDGEVGDGSVVRDTESTRLTFTLLDENDIDSVLVVYAGFEPDNFREGRGVTIEGKLSSDGVFTAESIFTKCASKYVPEE